MDTDKFRYALYAGEFYTKQTSTTPEMDQSHLVELKTVEMATRFVVKLSDDGLEPLGLHEGDYLVFKQQRWPTQEETVCICVIGDEVIIRTVCGILQHDVTLAVPRDIYEPIELTPQDFHVMGVLVGILDRDEEPKMIAQEDAYYGVY